MFRFLFIPLLLTITRLHAFNPDNFHVCTVANYVHPNLVKLQTSCAQHNISLEVIGIGRPYKANGTKLIRMGEYLNSLNDDHIVLFVDAFDVIIVADKEVILDKFLKMNTPFLMSAEMSCFPHYNLPINSPEPHPFRFVNTGSYMGYVRDLKRWMRTLSPIMEHRDDQSQASWYYLKKKNERCFTLDYYCHLFLPLFMVPESGVTIDAENKVVKCLLTGSTPCVIHANGNSFTIWNKIYSQFFES